jgi:hypothetical protein
MLEKALLSTGEDIEEETVSSKGRASPEDGQQSPLTGFFAKFGWGLME